MTRKRSAEHDEGDPEDTPRAALVKKGAALSALAMAALVAAGILWVLLAPGDDERGAAVMARPAAADAGIEASAPGFYPAPKGPPR